MVHGTSMSNNNTLISGDNKGAAARFLEDRFTSSITNSTTLNAQDHIDDFIEKASSIKATRRQPCGQTSSQKFKVRKNKDGSQFVGAFCQSNVGDVSPHVLGAFWTDSGKPLTLTGNKTVKTCPAGLGAGFAAGTTDGPGAFGFQQGDKKPTIVPIQILRIGKLVILSVPGEFTTMSGRRLRESVKQTLIRSGIGEFDNDTHVVIAGLTNTYSQYVATPEEYQQQRYEAAFNAIRSSYSSSMHSRIQQVSRAQSNKSSWVKWSVLAAKEKGGLGVSSLFALNRALLMKWFWRFYSHNDSLWSRVIKAIYGVDGEVNKVSKYASRSCWRDIINEVRKLKDQGINMRDFMYIKVGNGETTKFWDDIWIGSKPLKLLFPRIYALDNIKDASICMKLNEPSLDNNFRRSIRGGIEQSQFKKLTDLLIPIVLNPCPDRWFWSLEGSGEFSVASIRRFIDDQRLLTVDSKTLWIKSVPIKVNILAWKIKLEALPTRFNISRRGIEIDSILCPICDRGVESTRHIFFSCCLVRQIARKICSWWDIEYSDVNSFTEWINWMASLRLQSKVKMMIQGVFFVVWWLVWSYRNKLLFEEKKPSKAIIFDDVVSISFYWCKSRCKASFSWDDWLKNPSLISL
ncbi:RNA-directed DNA polymerase, eukaryota, reverse transcriptase zinc-binding domain protein [Tanacetum coccineum]